MNRYKLNIWYWFYYFSITAAVCEMVAEREIRTTLTVFSGELPGNNNIAGRKATDTDMQQTMRWPSLQYGREYQKCIQFYKCINGMAPAYLLNNPLLRADP